MVIGYDNLDKDGEFLDGYTVVKHPVGFSDESNVGFIPCDSDFEVVFDGYHKQEFDKYLSAQKEFYEVLRPLGTKGALEQLSEIRKAVKKGVEK